MDIKTNNVPRQLLHWHDLSDAQRKEHSEEDQDGYFFMCLNYCYPMAWFLKTEGAYGMDGWHAYYGETAWSGILIKLCEDNDYIIVGSYTS